MQPEHRGCLVIRIPISGRSPVEADPFANQKPPTRFAFAAHEQLAVAFYSGNEKEDESGISGADLFRTHFSLCVVCGYSPPIGLRTPYVVPYRGSLLSLVDRFEGTFDRLTLATMGEGLLSFA